MALSDGEGVQPRFQPTRDPIQGGQGRHKAATHLFFLPNEPNLTKFGYFATACDPDPAPSPHGLIYRTNPTAAPSVTFTRSFPRNKPNARGARPIAQLAVYAVALSRLTGIKLFDIKCAWFDEHHYCEFFLRKLFR